MVEEMKVTMAQLDCSVLAADESVIAVNHDRAAGRAADGCHLEEWVVRGLRATGSCDRKTYDHVIQHSEESSVSTFFQRELDPCGL